MSIGYDWWFFYFSVKLQTTLSLYAVFSFPPRSLPLGCRILQKFLTILLFSFPTSSPDSQSIRERDSSMVIIETRYYAYTLFSTYASFMKSFAYLFNRYLRGVYYVPGIAEVLVNRTDEFFLLEFIFQWGQPCKGQADKWTVRSDKAKEEIHWWCGQGWLVGYGGRVAGDVFYKEVPSELQPEWWKPVTQSWGPGYQANGVARAKVMWGLSWYILARVLRPMWLEQDEQDVREVGDKQHLG